MAMGMYLCMASLHAMVVARGLSGWPGLEAAVLEQRLLVMGPILHPIACPP